MLYGKVPPARALPSLEGQKHDTPDIVRGYRRQPLQPADPDRDLSHVPQRPAHSHAPRPLQYVLRHARPSGAFAQASSHRPLQPPRLLQLPQRTSAPTPRARAIHPSGRPEFRMARAPEVQQLRRKVPVVGQR